jgi:hypothetical protein
MKKRLVALVVLAVVLAAAPMAMADHCRKCSNNLCAIAFTGGYSSCDDSTGTCRLSGTCGGPHPFIEEEPFAAEFTVALVERLDEPKTAAPETAVASLEATETAKR